VGRDWGKLKDADQAHIVRQGRFLKGPRAAKDNLDKDFKKRAERKYHEWKRNWKQRKPGQDGRFPQAVEKAQRPPRKRSMKGENANSRGKKMGSRKIHGRENPNGWKGQGRRGLLVERSSAWQHLPKLIKNSKGGGIEVASANSLDPPSNRGVGGEEVGVREGGMNREAEGEDDDKILP